MSTQVYDPGSTVVCPRCGARLPSFYRYCPYCGADLSGGRGRGSRWESLKRALATLERLAEESERGAGLGSG